jgi:hypothetical protein
MISAVSFKGTQPAPAAPEKKEKKSSTAVGAFVGLAAGGGIAAGTKLGKKDVYADVDSFVKAKKDDFDEATKGITADDDKKHVTTLQTERTRVENDTNAVTTKLESIFGKDAKDEDEKELKDIMGKEGNPTLDEAKTALKDETESTLKAQEDELGKIQEAAGKLEKGKNNEAEPLKVKVKDPADASKEIENTYKISKDADGKVTFTKNTEAAVALEDHATKVAEARTKHNSVKAFAQKLGITADSADTAKVKKSVVKDALTESASKASKAATDAFEAIKKSLPKKLNAMKVGMYAAGGAILGALVASMASPKKPAPAEKA